MLSLLPHSGIYKIEDLILFLLSCSDPLVYSQKRLNYLAFQSCALRVPDEGHSRSFNQSNTTAATIGAGTPYLSGATEFTLRF
jgi:hypothetical protein